MRSSETILSQFVLKYKHLFIFLEKGLDKVLGFRLKSWLIIIIRKIASFMHDLEEKEWRQLIQGLVSFAYIFCLQHLSNI